MTVTKYQLLYITECNTLLECANKLGVTNVTLSRWINGGVRKSTLIKYIGLDKAEALDHRSEWIIDQNGS